MLRTIAFALFIAAPGLAFAEEQPRETFQRAALHAEVRGDDGTVIGRVDAVERDGSGNIVAVEIEGNEPADAPMAPMLVADNRRDGRVSLTLDERREIMRGASSGARAR